LQKVLADIAQYPEFLAQKIYLHAQTTAIDFYQKYGFQSVGDLFYECEIPHYKMEKR
jgi:predicted GNAT family N-acyltransferase